MEYFVSPQPSSPPDVRTQDVMQRKADLMAAHNKFLTPNNGWTPIAEEFGPRKLRWFPLAFFLLLGFILFIYLYAVYLFRFIKISRSEYLLLSPFTRVPELSILDRNNAVRTRAGLTNALLMNRSASVAFQEHFLSTYTANVIAVVSVFFSSQQRNAAPLHSFGSGA